MAASAPNAAPAAPSAATVAAPKGEAAPKPEAAPKVEAAPKAEAAPKSETKAAAVAASGGIPALDWSKAPMRNIKVFYPGQAAFEWVMNKPDHSSAADIIEKKRPCAKCHEGDANEIGEAIVAGKPVGVSKTVQEPNPPVGKAGYVPVGFQAIHDGSKIYFRFEWQAQKAADGKKMDPKNEVKLTMMFDGGGTVPGAEINGCWVTCHKDLRTMKEAKDEKKTKYIEGADLASGKFMDLIQFRSGKGEKPVDGYVADSRQMQGGKGLVAAEGKKEGNKWVVIFARNLAGGGKGDHVIEAGKTYYFGFAIHEDYSAARYHFVSLGYQFGLDKPVEGVKNYYNVVKQ
ncbi:MAG: ethylbenzene dehydrogenase-related protein [Rhodocyclaceae bacterium]|nr:ethylbenzene dehydrogenase-related protein [Rhodocyclaceae bacterium]